MPGMIKVAETFDIAEHDAQDPRPRSRTRCWTWRQAQIEVHRPKQTRTAWRCAIKAQAQHHPFAEKRGCEVTVFPATATADELLGFNPDGISYLQRHRRSLRLRNAAIEEAIRGGILGKRPLVWHLPGASIDGVGGGRGYRKLKYGHRGANHLPGDLQLA